MIYDIINPTVVIGAISTYFKQQRLSFCLTIDIACAGSPTPKALCHAVWSISL